MKASVFLTATAVLCLVASLAFARTWTDSTGTYTVEAELVEISDETVHLKKVDGTVVALPFARLSAEDRRYLESLSNVSSAEAGAETTVDAIQEGTESAPSAPLAEAHPEATVDASQEHGEPAPSPTSADDGREGAGEETTGIQSGFSGLKRWQVISALLGGGALFVFLAFVQSQWTKRVVIRTMTRKGVVAAQKKLLRIRREQQRVLGLVGVLALISAFVAAGAETMTRFLGYAGAGGVVIAGVVVYVVGWVKAQPLEDQELVAVSAETAGTGPNHAVADKVTLRGPGLPATVYLDPISPCIFAFFLVWGRMMLKGQEDFTDLAWGWVLVGIALFCVLQYIARSFVAICHTPSVWNVLKLVLTLGMFAVAAHGVFTWQT